MNKINLFPVFLYIKNIKEENLLGDDFNKEIKKILSSNTENIETASGNYSTTIRGFYDITILDSMSRFKSRMKRLIHEAWEALGYEPSDINIERSWINSFSKGSSLETHSHGSTEMVMTYYHKVPEGSSSIKFYNPFDASTGMAPFKNKVFEYKPKEGDLLAWPGFLWHKVEEQEVHEERIAISMHIHQGSFSLTNRWRRVN